MEISVVDDFWEEVEIGVGVGYWAFVDSPKVRAIPFSGDIFFAVSTASEPTHQRPTPKTQELFQVPVKQHHLPLTPVQFESTTKRCRCRPLQNSHDVNHKEHGNKV